jgi:cytochrome c553
MHRLPIAFAIAGGVLALTASSIVMSQTVGQAPQGDAERGRQKASMCMGCHNIPGYRTSFPFVYHVPKIDGQHAPYIVSALRAYKSGERANPQMRAISASLSDEDMADLAAYYSQSPNLSASRQR